MGDRPRRCLWETAFGDPPTWMAEDEPDRGLATRMCAGCLVRVECLELELSTGGEEAAGVWGSLNEDDRRAVQAVLSQRRWADLLAMPEEVESR